MDKKLTCLNVLAKLTSRTPEASKNIILPVKSLNSEVFWSRGFRMLPLWWFSLVLWIITKNQSFYWVSSYKEIFNDCFSFKQFLGFFLIEDRKGPFAVSWSRYLGK